MTRNQDGDVIAYTNVKDVSSLVEQKMREDAYMHALATEYDSIAIVEIGNDDKNSDRVLIHGRLTDSLAALIDEETANEEHYSRKLDLMLRFVHPDDRDQFYAETRREKVLQSFDENRTPIVNFRIMKDSEDYLYYQLCFVPLRDADGKLTGVVAGMKNVDDEVRKEMNDRQELEDARYAAEAANVAKSTFLFNMSHDIRTPMNAIIGFNNMAINHIDDKGKVVDCLNKVNSSSKHLLNLINDILDMARIESGKEKSDLEPTSISAIAKELVDMQRESSTKELHYETDFSGIEHDMVTADRLHTSRILANIISNAVKYTPEGGNISFTINETPSEKEGCRGYDFIVQDTGIGMSEEFLEHIFEEFSREKSSTHSGVQGTGLGMSITKHLVDLLEGTIDIESELDKGTKVTVHLDMAPTQKEEEEDVIAVGDLSSIKGRKVLLVEDNELNREIATDILEEYGLIVETAENGEIAVEKCREAIEGGRENYHDLILMDIQMPVMDGYEATRVIRSLARVGKKRVPIVAMTANAFAEDKQKALDCGMQDHLAKPINIPELERVLKTYIK